MITDTMRSHKMAVTCMKEEKVEEFESALTAYCLDHVFHIKDYRYAGRRVDFTLLARTLQDVEQFLREFAQKWNVLEMGVSQFARRMEMSDSEAEDWYANINKYQGMLMQFQHFEGRLVADMCKIESVDKLIFLKDHFMGSMKEHIEGRKDYLEGKEDPYTTWANKELERQNLLKELETMSVSDSALLERVKAFIRNA